MAKPSAEDPRLSRVSRICLAFPDTDRQLRGDHAQFLVRKKTFAYFLNDHHGDGIVSITGKVLPGENTALAKAQPERFYLPSYIGPRGWVALRLDVDKIDWEEVTELMKCSYQLLAPKRRTARLKKAD